MASITREELEMAGYSFVDDTDQIELKTKKYYGKMYWLMPRRAQTYGNVF